MGACISEAAARRKQFAGERYYTLNQYLREQFGEKVYKLALDGGMSCPNRDGTLGYGGCIFCSAGGSGEFAEKPLGDCLREQGEEDHTGKRSTEKIGESLGIAEQIERAKARICQKTDASKFIAYFQSYTNTYAPVEYLRRIFTEAISHPQVVVLSVATRPDCLPAPVIALLEELNQIKPVWVELGLQTIHEKTASYIRRGYELGCYEAAVKALQKAGIEVITHVILGLPGESREDMLKTVRYLSEPMETCETLSVKEIVCQEKGNGTAVMSGQKSARYRTQGIKLQLLHVLKGTDLAAEYQRGAFEVLSIEAYLDVLSACIQLLPPDMVIHRITGDGPKSLLIAPEWSANKKYVLNTIRHYMKEHDIWQGKSCRTGN